RTGLAGDGEALGPGGPDQRHRAARADVLDVVACAGPPADLYVPFDDRLLGAPGPAGQPEPARHAPLVHDRPDGHRGVLAVLHEDAVVAGAGLHDAFHDRGVRDGVPVVGDA